MKNRMLIVLGFANGATFLAGCVSSPPEPVSFTIDMTEYAFAPVRIEVKVGQEVTLNLVNSGQLPHEIIFSRDVVMVNNRPSGYEHDIFVEAGVEPMVMGAEESKHMEEGEEHEEDEATGNGDHGHAGFMVLLQGTGDQGTISFTTTEEMAGEWEMGCFELDGVHYDAGMIGTFIVTS
jgi:plastocyanin